VPTVHAASPNCSRGSRADCTFVTVHDRAPAREQHADASHMAATSHAEDATLLARRLRDMTQLLTLHALSRPGELDAARVAGAQRHLNDLARRVDACGPATDLADIAAEAAELLDRVA
jgi:hypothetical protein